MYISSVLAFSPQRCIRGAREVLGVVVLLMVLQLLLLRHERVASLPSRLSLFQVRTLGRSLPLWPKLTYGVVRQQFCAPLAGNFSDRERRLRCKRGRRGRPDPLPHRVLQGERSESRLEADDERRHYGRYYCYECKRAALHQIRVPCVRAPWWEASPHHKRQTPEFPSPLPRRSCCRKCCDVRFW